jgi:hypothetical protein
MDWWHGVRFHWKPPPKSTVLQYGLQEGALPVVQSEQWMHCPFALCQQSPVPTRSTSVHAWEGLPIAVVRTASSECIHVSTTRQWKGAAAEATVTSTLIPWQQYTPRMHCSGFWQCSSTSWYGVKSTVKQYSTLHVKPFPPPPPPWNSRNKLKILARTNLSK